MEDTEKIEICGEKMENLFEKLMDQIKMPNQIRESALFSSGEIENVEVHTERKLWKFQLKFEKILPVEQWKVLSGLIESAFSTIAETELSITVDQPEFDEAMLNDYYQLALTLPDLADTAFANIFKKYQIEQRGVQINLLVEDNPQLDHFVKKDFPILEEKLKDFGFGALTIRPVVDEKLTLEKREAHERKVHNMLAAESASQQQISELKKQRTDEASAKTEKAPEKIDTALSEGISFGRKINGTSPVTSMSFIAGEGSGVVFEGYVFDAHHREFASNGTGKVNHVLEMKIADETSIFQVVKWGRKDNEIAQFNTIVEKVKAANTSEDGSIQFEQGIWLRVRGNIAHDVYKDDLVMTANDVVEIAKKEDCSRVAAQISAVKSDKIQIGRER